MELIGADGEVARPFDSPVVGGPLGDIGRTTGYFPVQGKAGGIAHFGSRLPAPAYHDGLAEKPARLRCRHGVEDDLQSIGAGGAAMALAVEIFGLDAEIGSFGKKVHWARCLHATI